MSSSGHSSLERTGTIRAAPPVPPTQPRFQTSCPTPVKRRGRGATGTANSAPGVVYGHHLWLGDSHRGERGARSSTSNKVGATHCFVAMAGGEVNHSPVISIQMRAGPGWLWAGVAAAYASSGTAGAGLAPWSWNTPSYFIHRSAQRRVSLRPRKPGAFPPCPTPRPLLHTRSTAQC